MTRAKNPNAKFLLISFAWKHFSANLRHYYFKMMVPCILILNKSDRSE